MLWMFKFVVAAIELQVLVLGVLAQTSEGVCLPYYQWAFNSQKKSPCEVASSLLSVCNGGPYDVPALPDSSHYLGPSLSDANPCQCNSVTYSLMSACGACQGRTFLSWSVWSANCVGATVGSFPGQIPAGTLVPGWAYQDVTAGDMFDQSLARANANATESSAPAPPPTTKTSARPSSSASASASLTSKAAVLASHISTTPSSSVTVTSSSSTTVSEAASSSSSASAAATAANQTHANAVGAGAVGGLVGGIVLLGALVYWIIQRRRASQSGIMLSSPLQSPVDPEAPPMSQYIANTTPIYPTTSNSTVPTRAAYTESNVSGSAHFNVEHSQV